MKNFYLLILALCLPVIPLASQDVFIDTTFSEDGRNRIEFSDLDDRCIDMLLQSDGKIIMIGNTERDEMFNDIDFALARVLPNGALDPSFGDGGRVITDFKESANESYKGVIQPDGKIIVIGTADTGTGSLDNDLAIVRYLENGQIDESYGDGGFVYTDVEGKSDLAYDLFIQSDGKIVVTGLAGRDARTDPDEVIVRYNTNGTVDEFFGEDGYIINDLQNNNPNYGLAVLEQTDGKLMVAGAVNSGAQGFYNFYVRRYNTDGTIDLSFNQIGYDIVDFFGQSDMPTDMILQPDGKILICGYTTVDLAAGDFDYGLLRYNADGTLDNTFGSNGKLNIALSPGFDWPRELILQEDGKILVGGYSEVETNIVRMLVLRLNTDGTIDDSFGDNGKMINEVEPPDPMMSSWDLASSMLLQADGKIIMGGSTKTNLPTEYDFNIVRFITDLVVGTLEFDQYHTQALVYPNPIVQEFTMEYDLDTEEELSIALYSLSGKFVQSFVQQEKRGVGHHQETFLMDAGLAAGHYFLVLDNGVGRVQIKVFKP
ncbi:MAG: T9SS type A sorting domain-containing protein [Bacteroidota bacterium]